MRRARGAGSFFAPLEYDFDSLDNRDDRAIQDVVREVVAPMERYFQTDVHGLERVPSGPSLYVGNHSGGMLAPEIFLLGGALYRKYGLDALPYGLAHEAIGRIPAAGRMVIPLGAIRASHKNAARVFARDRSLLVFPGGDEDALRASARRDEVVFAGRRGYIRLALRHGVPIVPVVTFGAHDVFVVLSEGRQIAKLLGLDKHLRLKMFPIIFSIPWGISFGPPLAILPLPAHVRLELLEPVRFERSGEAAANDEAYVAQCAQRVERAMQACLTRLARVHRAPPTPLLATLEPGTPDNDNDGAGSARRVA